MSARSLARRHPAYRDDIGELTTRRPLPGPHVEQVNPFLFLNHHGPQVYPPNNDGLPFGPHPHRGFETVTFILEGELAHRDSGGHESVILAGGVQWMTAGSGLVHAEVSPEHFKRHGGPLEILQLWVNLPARLKFTKPAYRGLQREDIPAISTPDALGVVHLIAGEFEGRKGPIESLTGIFMATLSLKRGARVSFPGVGRRNVFLNVVRGNMRIGTEAVPEYTLAELDDEGDRVEIEAATDATVLFGHADAIDEPVVAHGPFVMNTRREIEEAVRDYQSGKFGPLQ